MTRQRAARIAAALFVITAALFVIGVSSEPDDHHEATEATATHDETAEGEEGEAHDEGAEGDETHDEEAEEQTILGIDVESPAAIALAVIASVIVAGALRFRPVRVVLGISVAFGVAFAVLDIAEGAHQIDESKTGLAVLAGVIAAGHLASAAASSLALRADDTT